MGHTLALCDLESAIVAQSGIYGVDIINAVKGVLNGIPKLPLVVKRKRPVRSEADPQSLVIVSLAGDAAGDETFAGDAGSPVAGQRKRLIDMVYTVLVTVIEPGNLQYEDELDERIAWRQKIRQALYKPTLAAAPAVWKTDIDLGPLFDLTGMDALYDKSTILVRYHCYEPVNG
jgi:hypothetical protein